MARKIPKLYSKDHPVRRLAGEIGPLPQGTTGSSAHRWKELEIKMNDGALKDSTFHKANIKGSTAVIVAPEEFSGSDHDQTFLQGVDVRTYEQATGHITAKIRTNSDYNIIRSDKIGFQVARVAQVADFPFVSSPSPKDVVDIQPTSSFPYSNHRFLRLDEPEYYADDYAPGAAGIKGSKAQLDTNVNKNKSKIYLKHYRERRDLGQANLFQNNIPYKDTTTVNPIEIVGSEQGNQIEFPPFMVHATDLLSTDGAIEVFPIRSVADRSIPEHPHTAQGVKSDLCITDIYKKSITIGDQFARRDKRKPLTGRSVRSFTSFICSHANAITHAPGDKISFTIGGVLCSVEVVADSASSNVLTATGTVITIKRGSNDAEFASNLNAAFNKMRENGAKIISSRITNTVFLREVLDRQRTKGVVVTVIDADDNPAGGATPVTKKITTAQTVGGFTVEFSRYSDLIYEGSKTRSLAGYDYFLDGVESFGLEVLDDAERVKLLTASIDNPDSEDPDDTIRVDGLIPWLKASRSGTFGERHIGPISTQGFIAPESAKSSPFIDSSDDDRATERLTDANTFAAKPNFFLTDRRNTLEGNVYSSHNRLLFQACWLDSATPFVTSSHEEYGRGSITGGHTGTDDDLHAGKTSASTKIHMTSAQPVNNSSISLKDTFGNSKTYIFGDKGSSLSENEVEVSISSSVTVGGSEYRNSVVGSKSSNIITKEKGSSLTATFTAMPADGSNVVITMPVYDRTDLSNILTASVAKKYVFRVDGVTGSLEGSNIVVNRGLTVSDAAANLKTAIELRHLDDNNNSVAPIAARATITTAAGNKRSSTTVAATDLIHGRRYTITFVGDTDFTKLGASANIVGTSFVSSGASSSGTGNGSVIEVGGYTTGHGVSFGTTLAITDALSTTKTYRFVDKVSDINVSLDGNAYSPLTTGDVINANSTKTGTRSSAADALTVAGIANGHTIKFFASLSAGGQGAVSEGGGEIKIKIADVLPGLNTANEIVIKTSAATRDNLIKAIRGERVLDNDNQPLIEYAASVGGQQGVGVQGFNAFSGTGPDLISLELNRPGNHNGTLTNEVGTISTLAGVGVSSSITGGSSTSAGGASVSGNIAIAIDAGASQPDVLDQIKIAVESANGHNGSILATKSGDQTLILTHLSLGAEGNDKSITSGLPAAYTVPTKFTGGVSSPVDATSGTLTFFGIDPDGGTGDLNYSKVITAQNLQSAINSAQGSKIDAKIVAKGVVGLTQKVVEFNRLGNTNVTVSAATNTAIHNGVPIVIGVNNIIANKRYQIVTTGDTNNWQNFSQEPITIAPDTVFTAKPGVSPAIPGGGTHGTVLGPLSVNGKFSGGTAAALSDTAAIGDVEFKKTSVYFPESGHYAFRSSQGIKDTYPSVCVISGSHYLSGRAHLGHSAPGFNRDHTWTVSYWMSGSDSRADHFCSVRDILHFRDTTDSDGLNYDTIDHYPNVPNFKVRHFLRRNYGLLYVSLYDNDFYPSNHHRIDFIFAGVRKGSSLPFLRNSEQENSLYNTLAGGDGWNQIAVSYDGGMHFAANYPGNTIASYRPGDANSARDEANPYGQPKGTATFRSFLHAVEAEDRHDTDTVTHGPNIAVQSSATLVNEEKYVIVSLGDIDTAGWRSIGVPDTVTPSVGTIFTYNNASLPTGSGTVRLKADTYFDTPLESRSSRTILYNYGNRLYEPFAITGSLGNGKLNCPVRLHLNGVDITDNSLEYVVHYSTRTTGHNARYGSLYQRPASDATATIQSANIGAASFAAFKAGLNGQTFTIRDADPTKQKIFQFDTSTATVDGISDPAIIGISGAANVGNIFLQIYFAVGAALMNDEINVAPAVPTDDGDVYGVHTIVLNHEPEANGLTTTPTFNIGAHSLQMTPTFTGGVSFGDYRNIANTGNIFKTDDGNTAAADPSKAFAGHTVMSSSIVFGGDPNAVSFSRKLFKRSTTDSFIIPNSVTNTSLNNKFIEVTGSHGSTHLFTLDNTVNADAAGANVIGLKDKTTVANISDEITSKINGLSFMSAAVSNVMNSNDPPEDTGADRITVTDADTPTTGTPYLGASIKSNMFVGGSEGSDIADFKTFVRRRVHANQNTNYISEFAMWDQKLPESQIKSVWELSRFNDVLFTVEKPMAAALTRMKASFEDGVDNGKTHSTKGFVFGDSEHGTDSIVFGGLKK